jgi:hypothetical protein
MLKSIIWGNVLYGDNGGSCEHIHRGHITIPPPVPPDPYMAVWFVVIMLAVVFALIGIPLISIWLDIKKHPNKPVKRVAKK